MQRWLETQSESLRAGRAGASGDLWRRNGPCRVYPEVHGQELGGRKQRSTLKSVAFHIISYHFIESCTQWLRAQDGAKKDFCLDM